MKRLTALVAVFLISSALHAQAPQVRERPIYFRELPIELGQQLSAEVAQCRKAFPLDPEAADDVRRAILNFQFKKPATMCTLRETMQAIGPRSIPIVEEALRSQSDSLRERAVFALRCLRKTDENEQKDTAADALLARLFHRTVLDRSKSVRESAVVGLRDLCSSRSGNPEAMAGLREALNDPDPKLRKFVEGTIEAMNKRR